MIPDTRKAAVDEPRLASAATDVIHPERPGIHLTRVPITRLESELPTRDARRDVVEFIVANHTLLPIREHFEMTARTRREAKSPGRRQLVEAETDLLGAEVLVDRGRIDGSTRP